MKKNITTVIIALGAIAVTTFNGCKKDADEEVTLPTAGNGQLQFHIHTMVDTAEVGNYGTLYVMDGGRKITVTKAQLYISNIQLVKLDGSTVDVSGVIKLKKMEEEVYDLGSVPSGNYKSVNFKVGLSAATNSSTPAASDSTLNQPPMWFDVTAQPSGFVFVNFQGTIDTTTAANGTLGQMQTFSYKIGTNANLRLVEMSDNPFTVSANQTQFVHLAADYNMLFNGIQLNNSSNLIMNTTSANATSLGNDLANNIASMFDYEN